MFYSFNQITKAPHDTKFDFRKCGHVIADSTLASLHAFIQLLTRWSAIAGYASHTHLSDFLQRGKYRYINK